MESKFPKPGEEFYLQFVETWKTVRLKDFKSMENPPKKYDEMLEELDDFEHEIVKIKEGITKCTCGYKSSHHAADCRIHPHYMVTLLDTNGELLGVESLFLEPVKFDEELFMMILADSGEISGPEKPPPLEVPVVGTADNHSAIINSPETDRSGANVLEVETSGQEISFEDIVSAIGDAFIKPLQNEDCNAEDSECCEEKYTLMLLLGDGTIKIKDAIGSQDGRFIFDASKRQCMYADNFFPVGEMQIFEEGPTLAAMVVLGDPVHLRILISWILKFASARIVESIPSISDE